MAGRRLLNIALSILVATLLLYLAFRNVDLASLREQMVQIRFGWAIPFIVALIISHWLRALRWELYLPEMERRPPRITLFTGVMIGYMMNYVFPRLGEVSRPLFVARQTGESGSSLLGTIVLERVIDLVFLILFLVVISVWFISDGRLMAEIFGTEHWSLSIWLALPVVAAALFLMIWGGGRVLNHLRRREEPHPLAEKVLEGVSLFGDGVLAIRRLERWGLFILYTAGIWIGYTLMAWLPFQMLDLHEQFGLGLVESMVVTTISAVGVVVPTPGGIGSYHLFIQQTLWLLYQVPLVSGLTYATVTHAATLLVNFMVGGAALWYNKYYTLKEKIVR